MTTIHPPKDLPREELIAIADETLKRYPGAKIYFKFTCQHCGARCTFEEPNSLYETGTCYECNLTTPITHGGFMLTIEWKGGLHENQ